MIELQNSTGALIEHNISLGQVLNHLHQSNHLASLLYEISVEEILLQQANLIGIKISPQDLQKTADDFRYRSGLTSAQHTNEWLKNRGISVIDFESLLERKLMIKKTKDLLTQGKIDNYFSLNQKGYTRIKYRIILVFREDLAQELLTQIKEENDKFKDLACKYSEHPSRDAGGSLGEVFLKQLSIEIAEVIFSAKTGDVIGPVATKNGFILVLVEELKPPELNLQTIASIKEELVEEWLKEQLRSISISYPLLESLNVSPSALSLPAICLTYPKAT